MAVNPSKNRNATQTSNSSPSGVSHPAEIDKYLSDKMDSPHYSPKLTVEKPLLPTLTLMLPQDGLEAKLQRWYDVSQDTINNVRVRSVDFVPDGVVRLTDKDDNEIFQAKIKLTDEFDGLPLLLARIQKVWIGSGAATDFWTAACNLMIRSGVPSFREVLPDVHVVTRTIWIDLACAWIAFLARSKKPAAGLDWDEFTSGDKLIIRFVDFYNKSSPRGPELRQPGYQLDRIQAQGLLDSLRKATTNNQKKQLLESLAGLLLDGVSGFEVPPMNKSSATGEIDRVVRNNCTFPTLARLSSPILVECKYWQKTVGTDPVGAFIADLHDARAISGFLFSRKPVSSAGKRRIENFYQHSTGFIVVITEADIQAVCDGANLAKMTIEKTESIIFQR
jgi:hypothetical protein